MGIGISIIDRFNKLAARTDDQGGVEKPGLVVATRPLKQQDIFVRPFINPTYGIDMNINAAYSGTPDHVHDGTDNSYWTASAISGVKFTFNSTDQNNTAGGSKSVLSNRAAVGDTAQFAKGSSVDLSGYVAITLYVYVDDNWAEDDSVVLYGWDTGTASIIGTSIAMEDYFEWGSFDTWHKIAIPFADMNLENETIDALRFEIVAQDGLQPKFYVDDIRIEQTGSPAQFILRPDKGTWFRVAKSRLSIVAAYDTSVADGTVPGFAYDNILGTTITNGVIYTEIGTLNSYSWAIRNLSDIFQIPAMDDFQKIGDGTNAMVTFTFSSIDGVNQSTILKAENNDYLSLTIQDDLSGLLLTRMFSYGTIERR